MRKRLTYGAVFVTTLLAALGVMLATGTPSHAAGGAHGRSTILLAGLNGAQEVPGPGDEDGKGGFVARIKGDRLCYHLFAHKIETAAAAHIHAAPAGVAGDIVVGLATPAKGFSSGCLTTVPDSEDSVETLSESELAAIRAEPGEFYVNVHNATFPMGAIRGQLF